ncbi:DinB superfamily protein [Streptoalloteichus tenebrarius]|uniref:DinB superfamily protein n=1 Tax=Streptoalloteichus tenebrarius (strain ATCC 17920 / DSM 40477 / JCM 4838 / CBS 697.72 / NBRC 16177 / NCIMB 11028 / NRRL B-12390 / A12253. 1 / ISP 5477) TaxID=1933 RepID=A0ABT1HLW6_STRSD|nr:DinB family protein [Streptoalloteichus tenebrarius]MCP2256511.1 DinB superfamily protein [Streptoalloteichus tenebrarius]BFF04862.1 DinB family protein [Streptoalloteichus tenebrarius]
MAPPRLVPLLKQFDFARERLVRRLSGPDVDSGDGVRVPVTAMTDEEYLWEPVPGCWSVRPRARAHGPGPGPGPGASLLVGAGEWGRDGGRPHPYPPPITTIAWRLHHLGEMLALRADHVIGSHALTENEYAFPGDAAGGVAAFDSAAEAWRRALLAADNTALDRVGHSTYPDGSDPDVPFVEVVWWINQELLHHGAEIALLRDLYRARRG